MRRPTLFLAAVTYVCAAAFSAPKVQAQLAAKAVDNQPLWEFHLNLQKAIASPLGQWALEVVEHEHPEALDHIVKFSEAIGLDLRTDVSEIAIFGDGFGEHDHTVFANIGPSTGNIEGWILAAPGYRSEDLDDSTLLHSLNVEKHDARAWLALPKHGSSGNYILVGSLDRDRTVELSRQIIAGTATPIANPLTGDSLLRFFVSDLSAVPIEIDEDEPGSAVFKTVKQFGLNLASNSDDLQAEVELTTGNAAKARQISQLLVGLKAMIQLVDDYEVQKVGELLNDLAVEHNEGEKTVRASLTASYRTLEKIAHDIKNKGAQSNR